MDSLSQLALGSAVGVAVLGRRTPVWKAALWGGLAGTLPDLDALVDFGDPIRNMTYHRAESHSLFFLTLLAPLLALVAVRVHGKEAGLHRWAIALWLALFTHPLLDWMTVYGTQLGLPFTDTPFGLGSMFIIDPLYTLPLVIGVILALSLRSQRGLRWNLAGLALSCAYLGWSTLAQARVEQLAHRSLARQGIEARQVLVTPTPFNTVLWRVLAMTPSGYVEGFHSFLDPGTDLRFDHYVSDTRLHEPLQGIWGFERMAWFTRGFYALSERDGRAIITDLRMGTEPSYVFAFAVAQRGSAFHEILPQRVGDRGDPAVLLAWTWHRMLGRDVPVPS
jgi:inner membrane protein